MTQEELNKKVDAFVGKYNGKQKGYPDDNSYPGQCLSIVKLYMKEVFGFDPPPSGCNAAYCYWSKFPDPLSKYFVKVENTPFGVPTKGCVPIWDTNTGGGYGHTDIFIEGDVNTFKGFDQNWQGMEAHLQNHNYSNVAGWLEPILETVVQDPEITDQTKIDMRSPWGIMEVQAIRSTINDQLGTIQALETEVSNCETNYQSQLESAKKELEECKAKKCDEMTWKELVILAIKRFPN